MRIMDYFDRAYIINLPSRIDRRRQMERMLKRVGLPPEPGKVEFFPGNRPDSAGEFPSIGARGCFLSHMGVLKKAEAEGLSRVLIMEDDLEIDPGFANDPAPVLEALRAVDWGLVYLGHLIKDEPDRGSSSPLRRYEEPITTAHFYAVDGSLLPRLVGFFEAVLGRPASHPDGGPMFPDGALNTFRHQNPAVATLVAWPNLGWQRSSRSDITTSWFDQMPGLGAMADLARAIRGRSRHR